MSKYYAVLIVVAIAGSQIALVGIARPEFAGGIATGVEHLSFSRSPPSLSYMST